MRNYESLIGDVIQPLRQDVDALTDRQIERYEVERFRLRLRRDLAHRDDDQARVNAARLRVRISRDFLMGASDVHPGEPVVEEVES